MGFSTKQVHALRRNLNGRQIRTREANGRELSYIEGWFAILEANRIIGFDGWSRETVDSRCVLAGEIRGTFVAVYIAKVRITVQAAGATGRGSGEGRGPSPGDVHDIALKAAETDASKRALHVRQTIWARTLSAKPDTRTFVEPKTRKRCCYRDPLRLSSRRYDADPSAVGLLWPSSRTTFEPAGRH
jgi:hypothetical protein